MIINQGGENNGAAFNTTVSHLLGTEPAYGDQYFLSPDTVIGYGQVATVY